MDLEVSITSFVVMELSRTLFLRLGLKQVVDLKKPDVVFLVQKMDQNAQICVLMRLI